MNHVLLTACVQSAGPSYTHHIDLVTRKKHNDTRCRSVFDLVQAWIPHAMALHGDTASVRGICVCIQALSHRSWVSRQTEVHTLMNSVMSVCVTLPDGQGSSQLLTEATQYDGPWVLSHKIAWIAAALAHGRVHALTHLLSISRIGAKHLLPLVKHAIRTQSPRLPACLCDCRNTGHSAMSCRAG